MMRGQAKITNPDEAMLEITITAPIKEWRALIKDMPSVWPQWQFAVLVSDAIRKTVDRIESIHSVE